MSKKSEELLYGIVQKRMEEAIADGYKKRWLDGKSYLPRDSTGFPEGLEPSSSGS
tara:strand:- start:51 stop:215 length:165 start_codon:yes stop_codon:yes gene_type:complete